MEKSKMIIISNEKNWMEQVAKDQLAAVSRLEGVVKAVVYGNLKIGQSLIEN